MPIDDLLALCQYISLRYDSIRQIRTIKGTDRHLRGTQLQLVEDIASDPLGGRRRQRHDRSLGKVFSKLQQLAVLGPEVVPPLRYAVGFVDGDHPHVVALEKFREIFLQSPFGGSEKNAYFLLTQLVCQRSLLLVAHVRLPSRSGYSHLAKTIDLVLHQRNQGADDDRATSSEDRRGLVAKGLASAGGHDDQRVAILQGGLDRLDLGLAKLRKAPDFLEHLKKTSWNRR